MSTALGVLVYVLEIGGKLRNFYPRKNGHKGEKLRTQKSATCARLFETNVK